MKGAGGLNRRLLVGLRAVLRVADQRQPVVLAA